jgi:hypothetical protein
MQPTTYSPDDALPDKGDYSRLEHFRRRHIAPPTGLYVTLDDVILFQGWAPLATTPVRLSIRMLTPEGEVISVFYTINVAANGVTATTKSITNLEGFILSMSAEVLSGLAGAVWVNVVIQRGLGSGDATQGLNLLQGYPSLTDTLSWPQAPPAKSIDGRGLANVVAVGNPAAGADYSIIVPAGVNWLVRSLRVQLVTSAAVANRFVTLRLDDGAGNIFADITGGVAQTASLTVLYTFANGLQPSANNSVTNTGLPTELRMPGGFRIRTVTANIQAADQFSGAALELETFTAQ